MGKYHHAIMGRVLRFMRTIFFARSISYFRCSIRKSSSKLTSHQRSANVKTTGIAAMWNTNRFAYNLFDLLVLHRHEFHCLSSRIQPSCCRRKALSLLRRDLSPLFWSGRDFGPGDQHPQESALVIMSGLGIVVRAHGGAITGPPMP